ncbi:nucleotidyltransferase family protein [Desulfovibrio aminophilus]|nr:nucleotidyltransferase family protein [Desulfovibrio aminophilus]MCM0756012.1 nucleotidyltransferase family protein [Desulfovibrio aminophilus]
MKDWRKALVSADGTVRDAVQALNDGSVRVALAVDEDERLRGVVTDGDIRRGLLAGKGLESPLSDVLVTTFCAARPGDDDASILATMRGKDILQMPVLDAAGRVIGLKVLGELSAPRPRDNWVVLMAGGLGTRLRPLTEECPKPLLPVGGQPLLETIMQQFIQHGFHNFFISVNYRADMVEECFGDGSRLGVRVEYLREREPLGTAGALGLLPRKPDRPVFVMNGDLLTRVDFPGMLDFHLAQGARATMAVRGFDIQVPYGVVDVRENRIVGLEEKPVQKFFVNAGIYVLDPGTVAEIAPDAYLDMPSLFSRLMEQGRPTAAFPIHEYWMDIGRRQDFDQANCDFDLHFQRQER